MVMARRLLTAGGGRIRRDSPSVVEMAGGGNRQANRNRTTPLEAGSASTKRWALLARPFKAEN
jgi:hypothetical protein